jgi:cardiolipin synthase C
MPLMGKCMRLTVGMYSLDHGITTSVRCINTEIGLLIDSPLVAGEVLRRFEEMVSPKAAYQVVPDSSAATAPHLLWKTALDQRQQVLKVEPSRGWWKRFKARLLALLPLQPEL